MSNCTELRLDALQGLAGTGVDTAIALLLDTDLAVGGEDCWLDCLLVPTAGGVGELPARLGFAG